MAIGARRVLNEGEPQEANPAQAIYRPITSASRGDAGGEADVAQDSSRTARRRMSFDTTTIRPGWHGMAGSMTTTIIKTKHVSAQTPTPRRRRLAVIAAAAVATIAAAAVSFGFLVPNQAQAPIDVALPAAAVARNIGNTDVNQGLAQDVSVASSLQSVADAAAAALAADSAVQAQQDLAKLTASKAGQATLAAAKAAWDKAQQNAGSLDYTTSDRSGTPVPVPDGAFIWPVKGYRITSGFGWRTDPVYGGAEFHSGIDLAVPCGTPIHASGDGVVSFAGWYGGFGNYVEINHGTLRTGYGHQQKLLVVKGQEVKQGDIIGYVGSTGKSTGCHVHFQALNPKGQYFDPSTLIH